MSNVIPIVSSSPPPFEEPPPMQWEDDEEEDEDFGGFAAAPSAPQVPTPSKLTPEADHHNGANDENNDGEDQWADFGGFSAAPPHNDCINEADSLSQASVSDSGLSSDISPKFEDFDSKCPNFTEEWNDNDNQKSATLKSSDSGQVMTLSDSGQEPVTAESDSNENELNLPASNVDQVTIMTSCSDQVVTLTDFQEPSSSETDAVASESVLHVDTAAAISDKEDSDEGNNVNPLVFRAPSYSEDDDFQGFPDADPVSDTAVSDQTDKRKDTSDTESAGKTEQEPDCDMNVNESMSNEHDEFADFEDFRCAESEDQDETTVAQTETEWNAFGANNDQDNDGDDWAAFGEAPAATSDNFGDFSANLGSADPPAVDNNEDDFGDFGTAQASTEPMQKDGDDDDFDDFNEFEDFNSAAPKQSTPNPDPEQLVSRISSILLSCFNEDTENANDGSTQLLSQLIEIAQEREEVVATPNPPGHRGRIPQQSLNKYDVNVWNNLKSTETTPALKYHWADSCVQASLLQAMGIDTRNILLGHKKQSAPVFAANLGLLEPMRGDEKKDPTAIVDTVSVSSPQTQDIPMPDFDWNSSGLTNPLDRSSSVTLDLDFFVTNQANNSSFSRSEALQKEKEILQAIEPTKAEPPKTLQPLENLLANLNFTPTTPVTKKEVKDELSSRGQEVIQRLPNLSFMHSKVLMFRLGNSAN